MKDSIGGAWLYFIFICFMFVIVILMSFSINYFVARRASNDVVSCIEEREGNYGNPSKGISSCTDAYGETVKVNKTLVYDGEIDYECYGAGDGIQYSVTTYIKLEIPLLGVDLKMPIKNKTRVIHKVSCPS